MGETAAPLVMESHVEKPVSPGVSVTAREPALRKAAVGLTRNHPPHSVSLSFLFFFPLFLCERGPPRHRRWPPPSREGRHKDVSVGVFRMFHRRRVGACLCLDTEPDGRYGF